MSVEITRNVTEYYTWQGAEFTWLETTKEWCRAGQNEDILTAAEPITLKEAMSLKMPESIGISEAMAVEANVNRYEGWTIGESMTAVLHPVYDLPDPIEMRDMMWYLETTFSWEFYTKIAVTRGIHGYYTWKNCPLTWEGATKPWNKCGPSPYRVDTWTPLTLDECKDEPPAVRVIIGNMHDSFGINETGHYNVPEINILVPLSIAENARRFIVTYRTFNESLTFKELPHKFVDTKKYEGLSLYDAYIDACKAVLGNLYIQYGDMDFEDFLEKAESPQGYTVLTDFKVGEYEYKDAIVRVLIEATVPQSEPSVSDIVMYVDIPDTDDRGTVVITDTLEATKVYFNRFYYNAPEVSALVIGGNTADGLLTPHLITTSGNDDGGRYFEIEILNANGQRTTGTISWVSKGY